MSTVPTSHDMPLTARPAAPRNGKPSEALMSDLQQCRLEWLSCKSNTPNYYELLGLTLFESNDTIINSAADRQMKYVRDFQAGAHAEAAKTILNELSRARICLTNEARKREYDGQLRKSTGVNVMQETDGIRANAMAASDTSVRGRSSDTPPNGVVIKNGVPKRPTPRRPESPLDALPSIQRNEVDAIAEAAIEADPNARLASSRLRKQAKDSVWEKIKRNKLIVGLGAGAVLIGTSVLSYITLSGSESDEQEPSNKAKATQVAGVDIENTTFGKPPTHIKKEVVTPTVEPVVVKKPIVPEPEQVAVLPEQDKEPTVAVNVPRETTVDPAVEAARLQKEAEAKRVAEAEAAKQARLAFNRDAWNMYQKELRGRYSNIQLKDIIVAAQDERNPETRAALGFLITERALEDGKLEEMNAGVSVSKDPSAKHNYNGMRNYDSLLVKENILDRGSVLKFDTKERIQLMHELIADTWTAYEHSDYKLADELMERATEANRGLSTSGVDREERAAIAQQITAARKAIIEAKDRTKDFNALHEQAMVGSSSAAALLNIRQDGDWESALVDLEQSEETAIAVAAKLDAALTTASPAAEILAASNAWSAAASSDVKNRQLWSGRANALLQKSKQAAVAQQLNGVEKLEFGRVATALSSTLESRGLTPESLEGTQGYVEGRDGDKPATVEVVEPKVFSLMDVEHSFSNNADPAAMQSASSRNLEISSAFDKKAKIGDKSYDNFYLIVPNEEDNINKHITLTIQLPENSKTFSGTYLIEAERAKSRGVDIRVYVRLANNSVKPLENISRGNFGAGSGVENISTRLPDKAKAIIFVVGKGTGGQHNWNDYFHLVEPTVKAE